MVLTDMIISMDIGLILPHIWQHEVIRQTMSKFKPITVTVWPGNQRKLLASLIY